MFGSDHFRKKTLVEYGFRLPAAVDNQPLKFGEFESLLNQGVFVSDTPAYYELEKSGQYQPGAYTEPQELDTAADPIVQYMSKDALEKAIEKNKKAMEKAAYELDFKEAARLRDEM